MNVPTHSTAILLANDLMVGSLLDGPARQYGWKLVHCSGWSTVPEAIRQAADAGQPVRLMVIDVKLAVEVANAADVAALHDQSIATLVFGPHVHHDHLDQARRLGYQRVWSRGELHRCAAELLKSVDDRA